MTAVPPEQYVVEVLSDAPATAVLTSGADIEVQVGTIFANQEPMVPDVIEVAEYPPAGGGYYHAEVIPYTKQGPLAVTTSGSEFPIAGGTFQVDSIAARVVSAPAGSSVVIDVLKNNVSIFSTPANRPTIASGAKNAVVGSFPTTMLADGDYIEVIITSVGSTTPGDTLTVSVRLLRIG